MIHSVTIWALQSGHLHLKNEHLNLKDGHLDLKDEHHTWRTFTQFDGWIFYIHELFICLILSLLKVIPAISDLYNFYYLKTLAFFGSVGDYPVFSNIIRSS